MSIKYLNSKKEHISGKYKYDVSENIEFIKLLENGDLDFDASKLIHKDGCWRFEKVKRTVPDNGWGFGVSIENISIEYKSEGSFLKQVYKLFTLTLIKN